jgi:hypothetical protein
MEFVFCIWDNSKHPDIIRGVIKITAYEEGLKSPKNEHEDCRYYIPSADMYGKKNGYYGLCLNEKRFTHIRKECSIYNGEVCWCLNPRNSPTGCGGCKSYSHENIISKRINLFRRVLNTTGISRPRVWGMILEKWLRPEPEYECECNKKKGE